MKSLKRPPNADVWEPGFLKPRDQYTDEELKELEAAYESFKKQYGPIKFLETRKKKMHQG
jgi:hypothetical protein